MLASDLEYSIVMPVFNKAALTKNCLETLRPTLDGAGEGEIIVIDNASSDETPEMLSAFPWARVVRNEENIGFSKANNQGARLARGRFLVLLNNDTQAELGWLAAMLRVAREPGVGTVGAKLLFPDGTLQHAGVVVQSFRLGRAGFGAFHALHRGHAQDRSANARRDLHVVTAACMVTPRELFLELGGLDEGYWNGNEDVDYCLKVSARGLRIVYEPRAVLTHFESQSGTQRFRRVSHNVRRLAEAWNDRVAFDQPAFYSERGQIRRESRLSQSQHVYVDRETPHTTVVIHGTPEACRDALAADAVRTCVGPRVRVVTCDERDAVAYVRSEMGVRGDRYLALVDARARLLPGWLDELIGQIEFSHNVGAATYAPELPTGNDIAPVSADARCTLLSLRQFPQHVRLRDAASLDDAIGQMLETMLTLRVATRGASRSLGELPPSRSARAFARCDAEATERAIAAFAVAPPTLVSIMMLSWNAPEYTKLALESIRAYTPLPHEIVIVDNGSREETTSWLRTLEDVRVIFNPTNRGFAGGNNQAIAAARGDYVVLLNNDTIVTEHWLEDLLDAFARIPTLGISAVRSNRVAGAQQVEARYSDIPAMHRFAAERREAHRRQGFLLERAIGLCLCVPRHVIDEVGGIDERFGVGNFEDDDFCLRVRAAGYRIYVCDDVFIHHFGSQTFSANKIDYRATMQTNWEIFARKWGLKKLEGIDGYDSRAAIARGFDREQHYVALPGDPYAGTRAFEEAAAPEDRAYAVAFLANVRDENDWSDVASFVRRFARAFTCDDPVELAIAATGDLSAAALGERVHRIVERGGSAPERAPDIAISDEPDVAAWLATIAAPQRVRVGGDPALAHLPQPQANNPAALRRAFGVRLPA